MEEDDEVELIEEKPVHPVKKAWARIPFVGKLGIVIVIILVLVGASFSAPVRSVFKEKYNLIPFDAQRAYRDHQWFEKNGPRMTGSDAEAAGANYIADQLEAAGLKNVHIEEYETMLFEVRKAEVSVMPYIGGAIPKPMTSPTSFKHNNDFVVQGFSGSHKWDDFRDDITIYDMENGTTNESWKNAAGKCGLLHNDQWTLGDTQLYRLAKENGLACLAVHNRVVHAEIGYIPIFKGVYLTKDEKYVEMPFFMMSKAMGDTVTAAAKNGSKFRLDFDVPRSMRTVHVTVGDVPGREGGDAYVMLGAHSDTVYNGNGAVDNTAGTVTILETARNMVNEKPKRLVRFAFFGGEEEGLLGSFAYVEAHSQEIKDHLLFYENADMTNIDIKRGTGGWIGTNSESAAEHYKAIDTLVKQKDDRYQKYEITVTIGPTGSGSDQAAFLTLNRNVCFAAGSGSSEYHTYLDNINHINTESEALFGQILGTYAYYLAENN